MSDICIACGKVVGKRQHGVTCDVCDRWQHRVCDTGITREQYFAALHGGEELKFVCLPCVRRIPPREDRAEIVVEALLEDAAEIDEAAIDYNEPEFQKIGRLLDREVAVKDFVVDFEAAMWKAIRHVFGEDTTIHGCAFHWGQAVWRQVQEKGLATEYTTKRDTYSYIRKLLCLPFLPAEHIEVVFNSLADIALLRFNGLLEYMRSTWFRSSVWPVECWSIFGMSIRTNNDVEGWHRRLNGRAGVAPPFYFLVRLLADEGQVALRNVTLVTELQMTRYQRRQYRTMQGQILGLWNRYSRGEVTATGLLKQISTKYKPSVNLGD